jgi:predicted CDP-diglyceride synthetase/phosphatidate cytidylyltransferase
MVGLAPRRVVTTPAGVATVEDVNVRMRSWWGMAAATWEGFVGGVLSATAVGTALWWATPFSPLVAAEMSFLICLVGFAGGLTMAAIKRDRGVKDYGAVIPGHGGVRDRIDALCSPP